MVNELRSHASETAPVVSDATETSLPDTHGSRHVTLIDLLDRLLAGGVVIGGHITLAVADIDLVELDLGIILASSDKVAGR